MVWSSLVSRAAAGGSSRRLQSSTRSGRRASSRNCQSSAAANASERRSGLVLNAPRIRLRVLPDARLRPCPIPKPDTRLALWPSRPRSASASAGERDPRHTLKLEPILHVRGPLAGWPRRAVGRTHGLETVPHGLGADDAPARGRAICCANLYRAVRVASRVEVFLAGSGRAAAVNYAPSSERAD